MGLSLPGLSLPLPHRTTLRPNEADFTGGGGGGAGGGGLGGGPARGGASLGRLPVADAAPIEGGALSSAGGPGERGMAAGAWSQLVPHSRPMNPFSLRFPASASELKRLSETSYARRRWLHVRSSNKAYFTGTASVGMLRQLPAAVAPTRLRRWQPHLEHQWASLTAPAVLPLTMDCTAEQLQLMRKQQAAAAGGGLWNVAVPAQGEVEGTIPYKTVMSAEEILHEMVCQRLEQDFQLLRATTSAGAPTRTSLSLRHETTYFLALGAQVQQIHFVREHQPSHLPPKQMRTGRPAAAAAAAAAAKATADFSEIKVTRHYIQPLPTLKSPTIGRAERPGAGGCRQTSAAPRLALVAL